MILVVGSGVAGLSCALAAAQAGADVELVTPGELAAAAGANAAGANAAAASAASASAAANTAARALAGGSTAMAQGGIAAALAPGDSPAAHCADTVAAGAGLVREAAARVLTIDGARAVRSLLARGFGVDRGPDGTPLLGLEGAHSRPRIVHAGGDRSGAALHGFLAARVLEAVRVGAIRLTERTRVVSLTVRDGAVSGAVLARAAAVGGSRSPVRTAAVPAGNAVTETRSAAAVVLASGGYAALFPRTTNHPSQRGDGVLLAARAGAVLADLEFVQFHPTVLASGELVSEAVRGAGAVLRDAAGARFMLGRHPLAELAPRDVVAREIDRVRTAGGEVLLDATGIEREGGSGTLARRFPGITAAVLGLGLDWTRDAIPVAPAAHYTMGGVASDLDGRTNVPGLFVAGEAAASGVHGANRLASNSLLEGLVFGERAGAAAASFAAGSGSSAMWRIDPELARLTAEATALNVPVAASAAQHSAAPELDSAALASGLGIVRDEAGLRGVLEAAQHSISDETTLTALIATAALERRESRGAHQRADYPRAEQAHARRASVRLVAQARSTPRIEGTTKHAHPADHSNRSYAGTR